jgi:hypothetical protein
MLVASCKNISFDQNFKYDFPLNAHLWSCCDLNYCLFFRMSIVLQALQVLGLHTLASLYEYLAWIMTLMIGNMLFALSGNIPSVEGSALMR